MIAAPAQLSLADLGHDIDDVPNAWVDVTAFTMTAIEVARDIGMPAPWVLRFADTGYGSDPPRFTAVDVAYLRWATACEGGRDVVGDVRWHRFGNPTSVKDVDLVLVGADVAPVWGAFDTLLADLHAQRRGDIDPDDDEFDPDDFDLYDLPTSVLADVIPAALVDEAIAIGTAAGLPLDLFVSLWDEWVIKAWVPLPYDDMRFGMACVPGLIWLLEPDGHGCRPIITEAPAA